MMAATAAFAQNSAEASKNAVCVTLKSGETEFVAFTKEPVLRSTDGKLVVVSAADNKQLVLAELAEVEKITAAYHDFSGTGAVQVTLDGVTTGEVYTIGGTKAGTIVPGKVYIIKSNGKSRKGIL